MVSNAIYNSSRISRNRSEKSVDISVFIPVYNGQHSLSELISRVDAVFSMLPYTFEYVLLDDGSSDDSWQIISKLRESRKNMCAIRHLKNMGYNFSLQHGLEMCLGTWVVTLDDDLQHFPEDIPKLLNVVEQDESVDVVFGVFSKRKHNPWRNIGSFVYLALIRYLYGLPKGLFITSFRLMHRRVIDHMVCQNFAEPQAGFMILKATRNIANVTVSHSERKYGRSGIKLSKMLRLTLDLVLHHTTLPLKLMTAVGAIAAAFSFLLSIFYLFNYFLNDSILSGFTTIVLFILGFGGMILFGLGIIGFYLSRLLRQSVYTPVYPVGDYLPSSDGD